MAGTNGKAFSIILTHEHTDFDALAAMLAAARLYPEARPVLPRQMNRNLEEFLALYGEVLPFITLEDLPRRQIDNAIVVDTQTVQPIRGMNAQTSVLIIDHHPLARELQPGWIFEGEPVGATTTLLAERMAERGLILNATEATLLLLGIYEDTGGLLYESTHPRDLRAAAWLLEHGASMLLVDKFLHHPLTDEQRQLYQQLADNSQPYQFSGQSVIIATATLNEPVAEISTLAHKLRDLYEPEALFMLVDMGDRIQLVARSTSDAVDVGEIASKLGGGGHARAAAAVIRDVSLPGVYETLVQLLQSHVRPTVTVAQLMSYGEPQTLAPTDSVAEAAARVQRYGFEGFPVVENDRIVGMVTRREIDRAMHHGLNRHPVSRYMRAGEVFVSPYDSVETLRKVMNQHDWGQVPVVDPNTGRIVGIVTRTDLIKQWTGGVPLHAETVEQRMAAALPPQLLEWLRQAGAAAEELGYPLYAVGGFVRDLLLGVPNFDIDLVVEGDAILLAQQLAARLGGRVRSHRRFGTAKWIVPEELCAGTAGLPGQLDFVSARTEFYERPTALPTVERSNIKLDLHRRDFTINTLAIRLGPRHWGELLDFYGGKKDLEDGIIRALHSLSFVEDPTRMLRAARFEQRFGFKIEPRTETLIADARGLLARVSGERVRHELQLIMAEAEPERVVCRLDELGVLAVLHPDLRCDDWFRNRAVDLRNMVMLVGDPESRVPPHMALGPDALPRLHLALLASRLSDEGGREFVERFRIVKEAGDLVLQVTRLRHSLDRLAENDVKASEVVEMLDESSDEARLVLRVAADSWLARQRLDQYQRKLQFIRPALTGDDLRRLGIAPGPIYRELLGTLRAARLDGQIGSREEEIALVKELVDAPARTHA